MKRFYTLTVGLLLAVISLSAQTKYSVTGYVVDKETNEAIIAATVQLLNEEDTFVTGAATDANGAFTLKDITKGKYTLRVSYVGYITKEQKLEFSISKTKKNTDIGFVTLSPDNVLLKETEVTANASKVKVSGDSIIFNAAAYRTPEGSTLEALVKKLPGAKVDADGKITINGKEVKKIMIDGKEFFLNDTEVAMKNIPVDIIDNIKTYDKKSDLSRITGIDDGEDETVLDLGVKKGMYNGWFGEINGAAGTEHRYTSRANVTRFSDKTQFALMGGMNNIGDMGFGGGGGRGWGWGNGGGLRARKNVMAHFSNVTDKLEIGGSVRFNYNGSDVRNETSSQNFVSESPSFSESLSQSYSSNNNISAQMRIEWKPDTMTTIMFRPRYNYSRNRGYSYSDDATFNADPNDYSESPLTDIDKLIAHIDSIVVNTNNSRSQSYSNNNSFNGMLMLNHKFNSDGRNLTLHLNGGINDGESKSISAANIFYLAKDDNTINNRYYNTPTRSDNFSAQVTYSEPIAYKTYLQLGYTFNYNYSKNDRQAYVYDATKSAYDDLNFALRSNRYNIGAILSYMDQLNYALRDTAALSQFSEYKTYQHTASLSFRRVTDRSNFSLGVDVVPINTRLNYKYLAQVDTIITKNQLNFAPRIEYRFQPDKMTDMRFNYNGRMTQPSLTSMVDIRDDSNPLNITLGNPDLKPSFSHNINGHFHTYKEETQRSYFGFLFGGLTQNSISNAVEYDATTGVRTTRPENINGNWNIGGGGGFNTPLDMENKYFTLNNFTDLNYSNNVGYNFQNNENVKATTKSFSVGDHFDISYRRDLIDISLNASVDYSHSRNDVVSSANLDTWQFSYGAEFEYTMPWGTSINTDIGMNSRRGYAQESMNTNELIWNLQVSHSMLKGKALTFALEVNDILGQQSNISRTINAMMRSDSRSNNIYQYGMLRIIYKFSIFAGKNAMGTDNENTGWQNMRGPGGRGQGGPGGGGRR